MRILSPETRVHVVGCQRDVIKFVSNPMTFAKAVEHVLNLCETDSFLKRIPKEDLINSLNSREGLHIEDANITCIPEEIMSRISRMPQRRSVSA